MEKKPSDSSESNDSKPKSEGVGRLFVSYKPPELPKAEATPSEPQLRVPFIVEKPKIILYERLEEEKHDSEDEEESSSSSGAKKKSEAAKEAEIVEEPAEALPPHVVRLIREARAKAREEVAEQRENPEGQTSVSVEEQGGSDAEPAQPVAPVIPLRRPHRPAAEQTTQHDAFGDLPPIEDRNRATSSDDRPTAPPLRPTPIVMPMREQPVAEAKPVSSHEDNVDYSLLSRIQAREQSAPTSEAEDDSEQEATILPFKPPRTVMPSMHNHTPGIPPESASMWANFNTAANTVPNVVPTPAHGGGGGGQPPVNRPPGGGSHNSLPSFGNLAPLAAAAGFNQIPGVAANLTGAELSLNKVDMPARVLAAGALIYAGVANRHRKKEITSLEKQLQASKVELQDQQQRSAATIAEQASKLQSMETRQHYAPAANQGAEYAPATLVASQPSHEQPLQAPAATHAQQARSNNRPGVVRPAQPGETRPIAPPMSAEQQAAEQQQAEEQAQNRRYVQDAWRKYEVDSHNREIINPANRGQEFISQQREVDPVGRRTTLATPSASNSNVPGQQAHHAAAAGVVGATVGASISQPGLHAQAAASASPVQHPLFSQPSLPSELATPNLPAGLPPLPTDSQHQLPPSVRKTSKLPGPVFWVMLAVIVAAFFAAALI